MPAENKHVKPSGIIPPSENSFNILQLIDRRIEENEKTIFRIILALSVITAFLLFDIRPSLEGDDSEYILRARNFIKEGVYPGYQGPLYPIVLGLPVAIFGINLIALKLLSVLFSIGHIYFMYLAFRKRIPYTILLIALVFTASNCYIQYYSSQTFTEAFFFFIQAFSLWIIFELLDRVNKENSGLTDIWPYWAASGLSLLLLSITKNVGAAAVLAFAAYFVFIGRFKEFFLAFGSFIAFKIPYELITRIFFRSETTSQLSGVFLKDPYDPAAGKEDIYGIMIRFIENFHLYISKHALVVLNLRPESAYYSIPVISFILLALFIAGLIAAHKHNKFLFFTGLYIAVLAGVSFIALQTFWDQQRIIIILVPLMLMFITGGLILLSRYWKFLTEIALALCVIILALNFKNAAVKISQNLSILQKNLSGEIYYGYTPGWKNFIELSKWASENLKESDLAASRKPSISSIYGHGKNFYGIYNLPSEDPDTLYNFLKRNKVTHLLAASLSSDPDFSTHESITAIHKAVFILRQKYPDKLETIKIIGDTEPSYLIKLK